MKRNNNRGSILQIQEGNLVRRIDKAVSEIMDNINDVTYPSNKARKVVITLEFKADDERKNISLKADIKKVLPAKETLVTSLFNYKVKDKVGNTVSMLEENLGVPRGQLDIDGNETSPALVAYKVDEVKPIVDETPTEIVKPLPEVKEEYKPDDEEKFGGTKIII